MYRNAAIACNGNFLYALGVRIDEYGFGKAEGRVRYSSRAPNFLRSPLICVNACKLGYRAFTGQPERKGVRKPWMKGYG